MRGWTALVLAFVAGAAVAQEPAADGGEPAVSPWRLGFEIKTHYRDSAANAFRSPFPFLPAQIPAGRDRVLLETVNAGEHFEVSTVTLFVDAEWSARLRARAKVDLIDRHDRNPTSSDKEIDVDELWLRFGRESEPAMLPERGGAYLKLGKFAHFERQDDRHLESYGLVATAFNRFEDQGLELGADLGRHVYLKASVTQGNPVFMRDPNALAGDNGTPAHREPRPRPELWSGVPILYDAEVESPDFDGDPELGGGLGVRFGDETGRRAVDLLAWAYRRQLADTVKLHGTFYGGDLDFLDGPGLPPPFPPASLPIRGDEKREAGLNAWVYLDGLSFFGQYVDQEIAGMTRRGWEGELAWRFELPLVWAIAGRQVLPSIAPAVRYSELRPEFDGGGPFPAPSVRWEWTKLDAGVRLGLIRGVDLTVEVADHEFFIPALGRNGSNNELLATLRIKH